MSPVTVRRATIDDVDRLVPLFDGYRQFYERPPDIAGARRFLHDRLRFDQSVVLLATVPSDTPAGFVQLFPSFSSTALSQIWILNDLFVAPEYRRIRVGIHLLDAAAAFARQSGASRLTLSTQVSNAPARSLYERHGWTPSTKFQVYNLSID